MKFKEVFQSHPNRYHIILGISLIFKRTSSTPLLQYVADFKPTTAVYSISSENVLVHKFKEGKSKPTALIRGKGIMYIS